MKKQYLIPAIKCYSMQTENFIVASPPRNYNGINVNSGLSNNNKPINDTTNNSDDDYLNNVDDDDNNTNS